MGIFGADDFAGGFIGVGFENLLLAVVLADYVEEVGETVVVVGGDVGPEERASRGSVCAAARNGARRRVASSVVRHLDVIGMRFG